MSEPVKDRETKYYKEVGNFRISLKTETAEKLPDPGTGCCSLLRPDLLFFFMYY